MRKTLAGIMAVAAAAGLTTAAVPSLGASTKTVSVKDDFFSPKTLTISKGTKVTWVWKGKERHNVAVANGPSTFRAGTRKKGKFSHTFSKRGKYFIVCTIHAPDMHMTVKVK
jgi:plastocyanin